MSDNELSEICNPEARLYGALYWGVRLTDGSSQAFYADAVEVVADGSLLAYRTKDGDRQTLVGWSSGKWEQFHALSTITAEPVAIEQHTS